MLGWYVAKSKPQKEDLLSSNLERKGIRVFNPKIKVRKRSKWSLEPLFPTYLFCEFDPDLVNWPEVKWTQGINYFINVDDEPSNVPNELIDEIAGRVESWNSEGYSAPTLKKGEKVIVAGGPFAGIQGIFQTYMPSKERCKILLKILGDLNSVEMETEDVVRLRNAFISA